ncbi:MAG: TldD/PmbA family protein [Firmicutes bacterium]|nr:TldD/PmbA family protein [Bacillota bacterium]
MTVFTVDPGHLEDLQWRPGEIGDAADLGHQVWSVELKGGQTPMVQHGSEQVRAMRMITAGRLGFATSRTMSWQQLKEEASRAAASGPETSMDEPVLESRSNSFIRSQWDPSMGSLMIERAHRLYAHLEGLADNFRPAVSVTYHEIVTQLANSNGGQTAWRHGYWGITAGGRCVDGTDFHGIAETQFGASEIPNVDDLFNALQDRFLWGQKIQRVMSGQYPMVFLPSVVMGLLTPVLARLSGPALIAGNSAWEDQSDQRVLSPLLTLASDATMPDGPRSAPFDDEGTPTDRWPLIDRGVLKHFVLDRDSSRRLGYEPLGMGYRATPNALPTSLPSNLVIEPNQATLGELLSRFPRMLVLNGWIGARPTNPLRGDIAGNASDLYFVDHGTVSGRVKNAVISINAFEALSSQLAAVGEETRWVAPGMMHTAPAKVPALLIDSVDVTVRR